MNNQLVYSFLLLLVSLLEASERQLAISDKEIKAKIYFSGVGNGSIDCKIIAIRDSLIISDAKFNNVTEKQFNAVEIDEWFNGITRITGVVPSKSRQAATGIDVSVFIKAKCVALFKKSIEEYCDIYKKNNNGRKGPFSVYFLNNNNNSDMISLCLSKEQVEKIIKKPSTTTSIKSIIVTGLGVAGIIAILIYYFNLHSKYMALSQQS